MKLGPKPIKCPYCGKWARSPEEVKKINHQVFKTSIIISIIMTFALIGCIIVPSMIENKILYPLPDFKADMKFSDFLLDENYTGHENCTITFMATGGYHYSDFNDLYIRLNFPDFCHINIIEIYPEITEEYYAYEGWYSQGVHHHIDDSTISFEFDPHLDGIEYRINLEITWDHFDVRCQKYESSLNHHEYHLYVLPDRHETFNHLTDFTLNGYSPEEYRFNMYINEEQVDWSPIWEGRSKW